MAREVSEFISPTDLDDLPDGTTYKRMSGTEQTKLTGIADNATIDQTESEIKTLFSWSTSPEDGSTADQTGLEVQTAITGLADADKVLISSDPLSGEKRVYGIHINAAGNIETDNNDTTEA